MIDDVELRVKLGANSFNKQIAQSSHLLVFTAFNKMTTQHVRDLVALTAEKQKVTIESLDGLFTAADAHFKSRSDEKKLSEG